MYSTCAKFSLFLSIIIALAFWACDHHDKISDVFLTKILEFETVSEHFFS